MGKYTQEQAQFIADNIEGVMYEDLKDKFNAKFGTQRTRQQIKHYCYRHGLKNGLSNESTRFKKGREIYFVGNPIGSESIDEHGQLVVKVNSGEGDYRKNWKPKKVIVWEEVNGEKPRKTMILCLDGNERNFDISNLMLVTTGEHLWLHRNNYIDAEPEVIVSAIYYLRLKSQRMKREKELRDNNV